MLLILLNWKHRFVSLCLFYVVLFFNCHFVFAGSSGIIKPIVYICDSEWPPYIFSQKERADKTEKIKGFSVDLIKEIMARENTVCNIKLYPWKRALHNVEKGGKHNIVLCASFSKSREERFYLSKPYSFTTSCYFYSKKYNPQGLKIFTAKDLKKYIIYGITGYNYDDFQVKSSDVDSFFSTHDNVINLLLNNRCDLFLESLEVIKGFTFIGKKYLSKKDLAYKQVPGIPPNGVYMLFTKNETGKDLQEKVNKWIDIFNKNGVLKQLWNKYQ